MGPPERFVFMPLIRSASRFNFPRHTCGTCLLNNQTLMSTLYGGCRVVFVWTITPPTP
jgi:hypothetical protein